ncbi:MAG: MBL fold metallo-hydrolase [Candidatus Wallbacteria bacterium]|nr:MBL fold metallo-hydrolase [Candidatus Wallbacteria bacterium]
MSADLTFHGATRTVTGSAYVLDTGAARVLVDCGMYQGPKMEERNRQPFAYEPAGLSAVLLTHAHIDHSGLLPRLLRDGFRGRIYAHAATVDLCAVLLADSAHIQEMTQEWANRKRARRGLEPLPPIYTAADAAAVLEHLTPVQYGESIDLPGAGVSATFRDAGHILGSAFIEVVHGPHERRERVVFSGDLGNSPVPILNDPQPLGEADYVLIESTYGHRFHEDTRAKEDLLAEIVTSTVRRGGNLIIPSFSVGRTQELLYTLDGLQRAGKLPSVPIFLDSPMSISATEVFRKHPECYDQELRAKIERGEDPLAPANLRITRSADESRAINVAAGSSVIVSANGMCTAGRILHHLKQNLWRPESTILFVGFQGEGTLGRSIRDGVKNVTIMGDRVSVRARIESIGGFSAHADQGGLTRWLFAAPRRPERVFVVHGEVKSAFGLSDAIGKKWAGAGYVPQFRQTVKLDAASVRALEQAPAVAAAEKVRGYKAHTSEMEQQARALEAQLAEFLSAAQKWAAEEPDADSAASGSLAAVRDVLGRVGRMACESSTACKDVLRHVPALQGKKLEEQRLADDPGKLGERLVGK